MTIHQLSIFIENHSGTLIKVLDALKEANIQIIASTVADTAEYGIYRIICSEPIRAYEELKQAGITITLSEVLALELDNKPGRAADAISVFSKAGISITYMYSFMLGGKGILVFRTDNFRDAVLGNPVLKRRNHAVFCEVILQEGDDLPIAQLLGHQEDDVIFSGDLLRQKGGDRNGEIDGAGNMRAVFPQGFHMGPVMVDQIHRNSVFRQIRAEHRSQGTRAVNRNPHSAHSFQGREFFP